MLIPTAIGTATVAVILGEINGFALMKNVSQLVSYTGYDVVEDQSGNRVGKTKISKKGNPRIRRALYFPAITAVSCGVPSLTGLFHRTLARHHIKMKSYVAVQKKLLILIYTLWKKNEPFKDMSQENVNAKSVLIMQSVVNGEKRRFPAKGKEPQGKPPYEMAVSSQLD